MAAVERISTADSPGPGQCAHGPRQDEIVQIVYTNYRGETNVRKIVPQRVWFGESDWHRGPQWFLEAVDLEKNAERSFALKDVRCWMDE